MSSTEGWIDAPDGRVDWHRHDLNDVTRLVVGKLDEPVDADGLDLSGLNERLPSLAHLHLWGITGLAELQDLPEGLVGLDIRGCPDLARVGRLPASLAELVLEDLPRLESLPIDKPLPHLRDLSLRGCVMLEQAHFERSLENKPDLVRVDFSGCRGLERLETWPPQLDRVDLNDCVQLEGLPERWPVGLRRIGLDGASALEKLPAPPARDAVDRPPLDYVDLSRTHQLEDPSWIEDLFGSAQSPRTLFLQDSGLRLPPELIGEGKSNRAEQVRAHFEGGPESRVIENELKVILIGNGRAGKSSLARRLIGEPFDPEEQSTHGIRLWTLPDFKFRPVDAEPGAPEETARLNFWDFAGQDLYHSTHRLFFETRAVYILCHSVAGKGSDPASDEEEESAEGASFDEDWKIDYWLGQIESLDESQRPHVIAVRTKSGRDSEEKAAKALEEFRRDHEGALEPFGGVIDFDAETDHGLSEVRERLKGAVASVLGWRTEREVRIAVKRVKERLQPDLDKNNEAHRKSEQSGVKQTPPHPTLARTAFDALVREVAPKEGLDHKDPSLVLDVLHSSGFLYANQRLLPEHVVLDQRWAIDCIYTAFDRRQGWPELLAMRGRCTLEDFERWGWSEFSPEHRQLFIGFLLSCGAATTLGTTFEGEREFVVFRALEEYGARGPFLDREAAELRGRGREQASGEPIAVEATVWAATALLQRLASEWGRSAVLWRWGGQFESFRGRALEPGLDRTFVRVNWSATSKWAVHGELSITRFGPDESLVEAVLRALEEIPGVELPERERRSEMEEATSATRGGGPGEDPATTVAHRPSEDFRDCVEIGISYAGDDGLGVKNWRDLSPGSIERWPRALSEALGSRGYRVYDYRDRQLRPHHEQEPDRRAAMKQLVGRDFVFAFLSKDYLESPWCMCEFMHLVETKGAVDGGGSRQVKQDLTRSQLAAFDEAYFDQDEIYGGGGEDEILDFITSWQARADEGLGAQSRIDKALGRAASDGTDGPDFSDWLECVRTPARMGQVTDALMGKLWKCDRISRDVSDEALIELAHARVDEADLNLGKQSRLQRLAKSAWEGGERDRACQLLWAAYWAGARVAEASAVDPAVLKEPLDGDALNDIRRVLQEKVDALAADATGELTWAQMKRALDEHPGREGAGG